MDADARRALKIIRRCVATGRYRVLQHFAWRMDERALFWPEVLEGPAEVRPGGPERWGRPKWIVAGERLEIVCVLDADERGRLVVFITIYERD